METIEKALYNFFTSFNDANNMNSLIKNIDASLSELERTLEIDTKREETLCKDDDVKDVDLEEFKQYLEDNIISDTPSADDSDEKKEKDNNKEDILKSFQTSVSNVSENIATLKASSEALNKFYKQIEDNSEKIYGAFLNSFLKGNKDGVKKVLETVAKLKVLSLKIATLKSRVDFHILRAQIGSYGMYASNKDFLKNMRETLDKISEYVSDGGNISEDAVEESVDAISKSEEGEGFDIYKQYSNIVGSDDFYKSVLKSLNYRLMLDYKKEKESKNSIADDSDSSGNSDYDSSKN